MFETRFTFGLRTAVPFQRAREEVEAALRVEGFGVLTEIDVQQTLKAKLDVDRPPYVILGACNPPLAHRAITAQPAIGALLPCNVVVREDGDATVIEAMDPDAALGLVDDPSVAEVAREAREKLMRALTSLEAALPATETVR
jgi:uncharacterized protein (DUF302 family)